MGFQIGIGVSLANQGVMQYAARTVAGDLDFDGSSDSETVEITLYTPSAMLVEGLLYIDADPGAFSDTPELTFYRNGDFEGRDALWRNDVAVAYTEIAAGGASGTSFDVADGSDFAEHDLAYVFDGTNSEFTRVSNVATNTLTVEDALGESYLENDGFSLVATFGGFMLHDDSGENKVYAKLKFSGAVTASFKLSLLVKEVR